MYLNKNKINPQTQLEKEILSLYKQLRKTKKQEWDRTLPLSELLVDRWEKAKFLKAKKGSSIYDNSFVFGNVSIGKNTWIGPYTILDGSGGKITIGDFCSISAGVQIYTHNSVDWAISGGKANYEKKPIKINSCSYIGPNSIISMGTTIGSHSIIGAHSLVNDNIPAYSVAFGTPAKIVGKIKIKNNKAQISYFNNLKKIKSKGNL